MVAVMFWFFSIRIGSEYALSPLIVARTIIYWLCTEGVAVYEADVASSIATVSFFHTPGLVSVRIFLYH